MITTDDELILADGIPDPDPEFTCHVEGCDQPAEVVLGEGDMELCADHVAELALQALQIIEVQDALARCGRVVLVLDETDAGHLRYLVRRPGRILGGAAEARQRLVKLLTERLNAIYEARRVKGE